MFETGVGIRNPLWFIGVIENCIDPRNEGRVQVRAFGVHGTNQDIPSEDLPWAICVKGDYNPNGFITPDVNDFVFGFFLDGRDAQQPMVLGLVPTQMTEPIDPEKNGWGVKLGTNDPNEDRLAKGSAGENFGQPQQDRLARGENVEETYVLQQAASTVEDIKTAEGGPQWKEPQPAYNAKYPFNKIIKTSHHVIELDDTPNHERIMIHHNSGSFIQIDSKGDVTNKSAGDNFEVKEKGQHVYIGGRNVVTIMGHSHVYYDGNVVEEINGDYTQIVHGNRYIGVGAQSSHNATEQIQLRAADIIAEANKGMFAISAIEEVQIQAGIDMNIRSKYINAQATDTLGLKAETTLFEGTTVLEAVGGKIVLKSEDELGVKASGAVKIGSGANVNIDGTQVNIDDRVSMAEGNSDVDIDTEFEASDVADAEVPELPDPPAKSTSTMADKRSRDAGDSGGITSQDDGTVV